MASRRVIVFLKAGRPGLVKTRLAAETDPAAAVAIHQVLVARTLAAVRSVPEVELRFAPADAEADVRALAGVAAHWLLSPQADGTLGDRLESAADAALAGGVEQVLMVGSDCPELRAEDLAAGFAALSTHPMVVGPASDGGYWLIGFRAEARPLKRWFEGIEWSTATVLSETLRRGAAHGVAVARLRELRDVDTLDDWRAWLRREAEERSGSPQARWDDVPRRTSA